MKLKFMNVDQSDLASKLDVLMDMQESIQEHFKSKSYGESLKEVCISLDFELSFSKNDFESVVQEYRTFPKFNEPSTQDVVFQKSLNYSIRFNYFRYKIEKGDYRCYLASDILTSLETIKTVKKIQDFNLEAFKADLELFFKENGWI